jgi:hypothetical protein
MPMLRLAGLGGLFLARDGGEGLAWDRVSSRLPAIPIQCRRHDLWPPSTGECWDGGEGIESESRRDGIDRQKAQL